MSSSRTRRAPFARIAAYALWFVLWVAVITVIVMTWHPWVIGGHAGCAPGQSTHWNGHCAPD